MFGFGIADAIRSIPFVAAAIALLLLYDYTIDDPHVRELARQGYVTEATLAAVDAERKESNRQLEAAEASALAFRESYKIQRDAVAAAEAKAEQDIEAYAKERELEEAKTPDTPRRSYKLNARDLERLQ